VIQTPGTKERTVDQFWRNITLSKELHCSFVPGIGGIGAAGRIRVIYCSDRSIMTQHCRDVETWDHFGDFGDPERQESFQKGHFQDRMEFCREESSPAFSYPCCELLFFSKCPMENCHS
jgi:hypothetical protein